MLEDRTIKIHYQQPFRVKIQFPFNSISKIHSILENGTSGNDSKKKMFGMFWVSCGKSMMAEKSKQHEFDVQNELPSFLLSVLDNVETFLEVPFSLEDAESHAFVLDRCVSLLRSILDCSDGDQPF